MSPQETHRLYSYWKPVGNSKWRPISEVKGKRIIKGKAKAVGQVLLKSRVIPQIGMH